MRSHRIVFVMLSIALCFLALPYVSVSAQESSPVPDGSCAVTSVEENVARVQELFAAMASGDGATIDAIFADDYVHNADRFGLPDDPTSNADEIELAMMMSQFYPNSTDVIREVFGAGDKVVFETVRTISEHNFTGTPVTLETPFEFRTMGILTFECGEIVSLTATANTLELMVALGVVTLPAIGPATPTA